MASPVQYPVYTGVWTNWSRGAVLGATLTLDRNTGNLLIAMIAFFVTWVGACLWRITCLGAHFAYSSRRPEDALYHQRQAVLRNSADAESGVRTMIALAWAWRGRERYQWRRVMFMLVLSTVFACGFISASGFSSLVSSAIGNEVLMSGENCATQSLDVPDEARYLGQWWGEIIATRMKAEDYARQCYTSNSTTGANKLPRAIDCGPIAGRRIDVKVQPDAPCPFDVKLCKNNNKNLVIDSGLLDSNDHLGINAPPNERFQYRQVAHCAPLVSDGYLTWINRSDGGYHARYFYGTHNNLFQIDQTIVKNYTYELLGNLTEFGPIADRYANLEFSSSTGFKIGMARADYSNGNGTSTIGSDFRPIEGLQMGRTDAEIVLFFLSGQDITFYNEITDPWYNGTLPFDYYIDVFDESGTVKNVSTTFYVPAEPASPLGCRLQAQLCNPEMPADVRCQPLSTRSDLFSAGTRKIFSAEGWKRLRWLEAAAFINAGIPSVVRTLGGLSLMSRSSFVWGMQGAIPDNQWMLDVRHWMESSLVFLQMAVISSVAGPTGTYPPGYYVKPNGTEEVQLCENQKILSAEHASFSVLGLSIIFGIGGTIVIISYGLDSFMDYLRRRYRFREYEQLEWCANGTLQLQRLAHEALDIGPWSGGTQWVPVTHSGRLLGVLDLTDPKHPRLRQTRDGGDADKKETTEPAAEVEARPTPARASTYSTLQSATWDSKRD